MQRGKRDRRRKRALLCIVGRVGWQDPRKEGRKERASCIQGVSCQSRARAAVSSAHHSPSPLSVATASLVTFKEFSRRQLHPSIRQINLQPRSAPRSVGQSS